MPSEFTLLRDGIRLGGLDYGGNGTSMLFLHGLAGHSGEWRETAARLRPTARAVALDTRGHGVSERQPCDLSVDAQAADAAFAIEELRLGGAVLVGQSLGGLAAIVLAVSRPDLVRGLVVVEADPEPGDQASIRGTCDWLKRWPTSFPSLEAAQGFFGGSPRRATAWADGLEERNGAWWPRFDADLLCQMLRETSGRSYWKEWAQIRVPILVVRAQNGELSASTAAAMVERSDNAIAAEIPEAGHDVHLDQPDDWIAALEAYLEGLGMA